MKGTQTALLINFINCRGPPTGREHAWSSDWYQSEDMSRIKENKETRKIITQVAFYQRNCQIKAVKILSSSILKKLSSSILVKLSSILPSRSSSNLLKILSDNLLKILSDSIQKMSEMIDEGRHYVKFFLQYRILVSCLKRSSLLNSYPNKIVIKVPSDIKMIAIVKNLPVIELNAKQCIHISGYLWLEGLGFVGEWVEEERVMIDVVGVVGVVEGVEVEIEEEIEVDEVKFELEQPKKVLGKMVLLVVVYSEQLHGVLKWGCPHHNACQMFGKAQRSSSVPCGARDTRNYTLSSLS